MKNAWRTLVSGGTLIVLLTVGAYIPALRAGFIWDDDLYVTSNPRLRSAAGLWQIWLKPEATVQYYPLTLTVFWVEYHLWGLHPFGYHLVNVLLQAANAVLLWRLLTRLRVPGAWWAAAVFALHPVMVESVAWVTERKNVLSCLFYLLAALAYLQFRPLTGEETDRTRRGRFYWLTLVLFLCALLSKTVTCSLPAALVLVVWWKAGHLGKRDAWALVPLFALGATLGLATVWFEKYQTGARGPEWDLSIVQRFLVAGRALWFYAGKLIWPSNLTFIYPRWEVDAGAAWQYVFPWAALVVLTALWLIRSRIGRGPLVAVLFFAVTLVPALGFFDVYPFRYSFVADHFQYIACIGLIALTAGAGATISQQAGQWGRRLGALAGGIALLILAASTWTQAHVYRDLETLWRDTLAKNPNAWMAHDNLGIGLTQVGKFDEAIGHFEYTLRLRPDDEEAHYNLGLALWQVGKLQPAIVHWERALQLKPDFPEVHNNLGFALMQEGRLQDAIEHYQQALRLQPNNAQTHYNLGLALWQAGRSPAAIEHWEQALRIKPDYSEAHYNLAFAFEQAGKVKEASEHYSRAVQINPDFARARDKLRHLQNIQ